MLVVWFLYDQEQLFSKEGETVSEATRQYIEDDIQELERLKKLIPPNTDECMEIINYKLYFQMFLTTLKIAVNNGTLTEYEADELRRKYARISGGDHSG